jgi:Ca-activated chloride channel family protein
MSFRWPEALVALALLPLATAGYILLHRRRSETIARFTNPLLYPNLVDRHPGRRRHIPAALLLAALTALLVGVARPQASLSVRREEATIVLAMDVSRSMAATDIAPSRLAAARAAALVFLREVPDRYRVGVVAFARRADVVSPATRGRDVTRAALAALRPAEGTAIGDAITRSLEVARAATKLDERPGDEARSREPSPAAILLLSDGAQTQGRLTPAAGARRAATAGVPVYTVALGTEFGVVERALPGGAIERIRVPPDPRTLRQIATLTHAEAFDATNLQRLKRVYEDLGSRLGRQKEDREVTFALAAAGGVLALVAAALSELWFRRFPA